jgi:hypothetical protein
MPLAITHRSETDVPTPSAMGRVNADLEAVKSEMRKLSSGMVLQIEAESAKGVRSAKTLVSRAAKQLGTRWQHWHVGSTVFAKPAEGVRKRVGRPRKNEASA